MSSVDDFSKCNKSDTKNQRENPTETKFATVNHKTRKKKTT